MFLGNYKSKFFKNRIILPKKFRKEVDDQEVILTKGLDGCIWGFAKKDWVPQARKQLEKSVFGSQGRFLRRRFFSQAFYVELDHQGRMVIHPSLIDFAQIRKEVLLIGAGDHFEIWNPGNLSKLMPDDYKY